MFPLPLVVTIRPSRRLSLAVAALHLIAGMAVWLAALPIPAQIAGSLLLAVSLAMRRHPVLETTLRGLADGTLEIRRNDAWHEIKRVSYKLVLPLITILRIQPAEDSRPRYLVMLPDSLPPEDFRRLRVWMEWLGKKPKEPVPSENTLPQTAIHDLKA